jgi:hypothetical protein
MSAALKAAHEINELWRGCLDGSEVELADCPEDSDVAAIIEKHVKPPTKE